MGDANQIKELVAASSKEHLSKSLNTIEKDTTNYDFDKEFAATSKNKSYFVMIVSVLTILAFVIVAIIITYSIKKTSEATPVNVASFEDLNLKDLLDVAKRSEQELATCKRELNDLETKYEYEKKQLETYLESQIETINIERISASQKSKKIAAVQSQYDKDMKALAEKYKPLIAEKKLEVEEATKAIEAYDSRMLDQAKKNEEAIAAERTIYENEKAELSKYYEDRIATLKIESAEELAQLNNAKDTLVKTMEKAHEEEINELILLYNPIIQDEKFESILSKESETVTWSDPIYPQSFLETGVVATEQIENIKSVIEKIDLIDSKFSEIPYTNSVPSLLASYKKSATELLSTYISLLDVCSKAYLYEKSQNEKLVKDINALKTENGKLHDKYEANLNELNIYKDSIEYLALNSGDSGYILKIENDSVIVWLDKLSTTATDAVVIRDGISIAKLKLKKEGSFYRAQILDIAQDITLRPFETVLVTITETDTNGGN